MKERPILFSAPMVRAILEGRKTQTRRLINMVGLDDRRVELRDGILGSVMTQEEIDAQDWMQGTKPTTGWIMLVGGMGPRGEGNPVRCPYGQAGDRLWGKETHRNSGDGIIYAAGGESGVIQLELSAGMMPESEKWRPSIFMPRWASRITLDVVSVKVERLQDITEGDAIEEGITWGQDHDYIGEYRKLWESINGPGSWEANPWVWVIEFRRVAAAI